MGKEIERKFKIKNDKWQKLIEKSISIQQGYLNLTPERTVRIRIQDDLAFLTVKGKNVGSTRLEFEYPIPIEDARDLFQLCEGALIKKTRNIVTIEGAIWEIDIFDGENKGLQVAEVELENEEQVILIPEWIGDEVTNDSRYYNSNLVSHPFCKW